MRSQFYSAYLHFAVIFSLRQFTDMISAPAGGWFLIQGKGKESFNTDFNANIYSFLVSALLHYLHLIMGVEAGLEFPGGVCSFFFLNLLSSSSQLLLP